MLPSTHLMFRQHLSFLYSQQPHLICNHFSPFTEGATGIRVRHAVEGHLPGQRQRHSTALPSPFTECLFPGSQLPFSYFSHSFFKRHFLRNYSLYFAVELVKVCTLEEEHCKNAFDR